MIHVITNASRWISRWTMSFCILLVYVMLLLLSTQLIARYFFGSPPSWAEEVAISLFAWVIMLAGSVGVRENFHVAVDLLSGDKPSILKRISDRLVLLLTLGFGGLLTVSGYSYVVETRGQMSAAMQYPIEALHLSAFVSGCLICLHALARFIEQPDGGDHE